MSGILNTLLARGGGASGGMVTPLGLVVNANGATATASATFVSDGTLTYANVGGSNNGQPNWFTATTAGIGSSRWINFTITSGVFTATPGTAGTWISMSGSTIFRNTAVASSTRVGQASFSIASDAAGTTVVGTGTVNCSVN